jgi:hypothetical protein
VRLLRAEPVLSARLFARFESFLTRLDDASHDESTHNAAAKGAPDGAPAAADDDTGGGAHCAPAAARAWWAYRGGEGAPDGIEEERLGEGGEAGGEAGEAGEAGENGVEAADGIDRGAASGDEGAAGTQGTEKAESAEAGTAAAKSARGGEGVPLGERLYAPTLVFHGAPSQQTLTGVLRGVRPTAIQPHHHHPLPHPDAHPRALLNLGTICAVCSRHHHHHHHPCTRLLHTLSSLARAVTNGRRHGPSQGLLAPGERDESVGTLLPMRHGRRYGDGRYLTHDVHTAAQYALRDANSKQQALLCLVVPGRVEHLPTELESHADDQGVVLRGADWHLARCRTCNAPRCDGVT